MTTDVATIPLSLPVSLKLAIEDFAERNGSNLDQFLVLAAAEKLSAMMGEEFFVSRRNRANEGEFLRLLNRKGGEPPRPEDTLE